MTTIQSNASISVNVNVDGTATSWSVDLSLPPFSLNFTGNLPVGVEEYSDTESGSATIAGTTLTVTYASAPSAGAIQGSFKLLYGAA